MSESSVCARLAPRWFLIALAVASCGGGDGAARDAAADLGARLDLGDGPLADAPRPPPSTRDINGDTFDDIVVGAPALGGEARVFLGGAALDATADGNLAASGLSLGLVDFNGDGFSDVVAGTPADGFGGLDAGRVDVFFGEAGAVVDGDADWTAHGLTGDLLGFAVSGAGDLNGDGIGDLVAGAPGDGDTMNGRALVFFGAADPDTNADGTLLGAAAGDALGAAVAGVPDVNGDSFDDLLVGAPEAGGTMLAGDGAAMIFRGGAGSAFDATPDGTSLGSGEELGTSVIGLGDANGDGFGDFAIGAPRHSSSAGRVWVFFGGTSIDMAADGELLAPVTAGFFGATLGTGDFNGDGRGDLSVGSQFSGRVDVYFGSSGAVFDAARDVFVAGIASSAVAAAVGDVNGDDFDELVIGLPSASTVDVYFGGNPVDTTTAEATLLGAPAALFGTAIADAAPTPGAQEGS